MKINLIEELEPRQLLSGDPAILLTAGAGQQDAGRAIAADAAGNVYVAGTFQSKVRFDNDPNQDDAAAAAPAGSTVRSQGSDDGFVAKYDRDGALRWVFPIGNEDFDSANDIAVDASGNVYVVGEFQGRLRLAAAAGGDSKVKVTLRSSRSRDRTFTQDAYILKLKANGRLQWARRIGGRGFDEVRAVAIDDSGLYVAGAFERTVDFDPAPDAKTRRASAGKSDIFVLKLSKGGSFGYVRRLGGKQMDIGVGLAADPTDAGVYVTGRTHTADGNAFVARLDRKCKTQWMREVGGSERVTSGNSIAIDPRNGDALILGVFQGVADFDPSAGELYLSSSGAADSFIARFKPNGRLRRVRQLGGSGITHAGGIAVDNRGVTVITGSFTDRLIADTAADGKLEIASAGDEDAFLARYSPGGSLRSVGTFGGTRQDTPSDLYFKSTDNAVVLSGFFKGRANFELHGNPTPEPTGADDEDDPRSLIRRSSGDFDVFAVQYAV